MQLVKIIVFTLALFVAGPAFSKVVDCVDLRWKLVKQGRPAIYRGSVKPGSAVHLQIEVRNKTRIIGQASAVPNGGGNWQMRVWGDYNIKKRHKERFYCHK